MEIKFTNPVPGATGLLRSRKGVLTLIVMALEVALGIEWGMAKETILQLIALSGGVGVGAQGLADFGGSGSPAAPVPANPHKASAAGAAFLLLAGLFAASTLTGCTATGGLPANFVVSSEGAAFISTDGNTAVIVANGKGYAMLRGGSEMGIPIWLLEYNKAGTYVFIRELDPDHDGEGETVSEFFEPGIPLPPELEDHVRGVVSEAEVNALGLSFGVLPTSGSASP